MATYVNDLRLKEIATGDESGTWGTSTNTNLELIAEAFSFGTEAITTNADTHTTTIADGSTDPGRSIYLKYTGALDSDCTVTIGPNTVSKLWFIENATTDSGSSGPYNIIIKQGSGATITVPNGQVKAIYSDGAGSGGAMVDAFTNLNVANNLSISGSTPTLTIGDAGAEDTKIVFDGNAQDFYVGLDDSADDLVIGKGSTVGTNPAIEIDENMDIKFAQSIGVGQAASSTTGDIVAQTMSLLGTTPTLTLGDGGEEDVKIQFNGVKDFYIANDDSADKLVIGEGSTVGTNSILTITDDALTIGDAAEVDTKIVFDGNAQDYYVGLDDSADSLVLGLGSTVGTTPAITINSSQQASFAQAVTADAGVAIDNITIDGTEIDLSSGDLTLDVAGDIILDAGGADILLKDDGTQFGELTNSSSDFVIKSSVSDKDIIFQGNDGGSGIEAMRIDMSAGGFVGIGTSSPDELLTISKNASSDSPSLIVRRSTDTSSSGDFVQGIKFANGTLSQRAEIQAVQGSQYADNIALNFVTMAGLGDRGTRMHIGGTGNVGIGTTSPDSILHLETSTNPTLSFYRNDSSILINNTIGTLQFGGSDSGDTNDAATIKAEADAGWGASSCATRLVFGTTPTGSTSASERMRIDSSGRLSVGISSSAGGVATFFGTGTGAEAKVQIEGEGGADPFINFLVNNTTHWAVGARDSDSDKFMIANNSDLSSGVALTIDSAENVGIGTTSPVSLGGHDGVLTLFGSNATALVLKNDTSSSRLAQLGSDLGFFVATHENERMRLTSTGLGIGTTSPSQALDVTGRVYVSSDEDIDMDSSANGHLRLDGDGYACALALNATALNIYTNSSSRGIIFGTNETERARFTGAGTFLVGKTSVNATGFGTELRGQQVIIGKTDSGTVNGIFFTHNSTYVGGLNYTDSATSLVTSSDERLKENILNADNALDKLNSIKVRQFDWKVDGSHQDYGFVAQELEPIYDFAVHTAEDEEATKSVDYASLVPLLTKAIQEQQEQIESLKSEIQLLKGGN